MNKCLHPTTEIRQKKAGKVFLFARQCLVCGNRHGDWIKRPHHGLIPWWDETLSNRYWSERGKQREEEKRKENEEWWRKANEYYNSAQWKWKRERVLKRNPTCQACERRKATEVHHIYERFAYRTFGDEPLFVLAAVCGPCHNQITELHRNGKVP